MRRSLVLGVSALLVLAASAAPASAASEFHAFSTSFGEPGAGAGQLSLRSPELIATNSGGVSRYFEFEEAGSGLAVNDETHDLYVGDTGNDRVEEFTSSGSFVRAFGTFSDPTFVAVDNSGGPSAGDVYVVDAAETRVSKFEADGTAVGGWGTSGQLTGLGAIKGIAVDNEGGLFLLDNMTMHWLNQDGTVHSSPFGIPRGSAPGGLAVDAEGNLYKLAATPETVKFSDTGEKLAEPDKSRFGRTLTIDPSDDDLYVLQGGESGGGGSVSHFALNCGENCDPLDSFGREDIASPQGIAIDPGLHRVYVGDSSTQRILAFGPVPGFSLAVTKAGSGAGRVASDPSGINCGSTCTREFAEDATVTLTATPDERSTFAGWGSGDCEAEPAPNECEVEMSAAKSVEGEFEGIPQEKLTVTRPGGGTGTVTGSSPGEVFTAIDCGSTCEAEYNQGATVTLTAISEIGSSFAGWTGCKAEPAGKCEVELSAASSVVAKFVASAGHLFSLDITGTGPTALSGPTEVAVDQTSHDIYVNDPGNYRVEKFDPSGSFVLMVGKEVNATTGGNLCTAASGNTCQPGSLGTEPSEFEDPAFLAVDNSGGPSNGDLYVSDTADNLIQKFGPSGHIVPSWGASGQKDGTDAVQEFPFHFRGMSGIDVSPTTGDLYVHDLLGSYYVFIFAQNGNFIRYAHSQFRPEGTEYPGFKVDPAGNFYEIANVGQSFGALTAVVENSDSGEPEQSFPVGRVTSIVETSGFAFDPAEHSLYQDVSAFEGAASDPENVPHGAGIEKYDSGCDAHDAVCDPVESFGVGHVFGAEGISIDGSNSTVYVANSETSDVAVFIDARPTVTSGPATSTTETGATLTGTVDPQSHGINHGPIAECHLEYGVTDAFNHTFTYDHSVPCNPDPQSGTFTTSTPVTATVSGLTPLLELPNGTTYHYRFVATNEAGSTDRGAERVFKTTAQPRIEGVSSSHVTATSADLEATVDPHGLPTAYIFEYGPNVAYGQSTSGEIAGSLAELSTSRAIKAHVEDLQSGATYHFRLVAHNADSPSDAFSEDQTFEFVPSACPNSAVRQQTGAALLPDCRGYELVSPPNANASLYYPGGPNTGQATSPSRFAYTGAYSAPPGANPINTAGDLYVATRTSSGWISHYIGLPGDQAGCMGGPPTDPRTEAVEDKRQITNTVLTDPSMSHFLDFLDGSPIACIEVGPASFGDQDSSVSYPSNAPYQWSADGALEQRLLAGPAAAVEALACPYATNQTAGDCTGETTASGDLNHLVFSSAKMSFSGPGEPAGLTVAPGSAYDENIVTGKISLISKLPAALGEGPIPQDPSFATQPQVPGKDGRYGGEEEFIRFPAVSRDGSHILMSTATTSVPFRCRTPGSSYACERYIEAPLHLYMRIGDSETYEIAENPTTHEPAPVSYVGMTPDGAKVFFTSEEHLTHEDEEHGGASLFMWSAEKMEEGKEPLTLISKSPPGAPGEPGNSADCSSAVAPIRGNAETEKAQRIDNGREGGYTPSPWTTSCGVRPYSGYGYSWLDGGRGGSGFEGSFGGSGFSPSAIADNGDIYFYSPERIDGVHGSPGQQNLFLYRNGQLRYVTTLTPERRCGPSLIFDGNHCSEGPIVRLQLTPDDSHMAFITASQVTPYDNAGHLEMYTYTPSSGELRCVSCNPDGRTATADVFGSEDGLFLTDDGRAFFSTTESLVPRDTNEGEDVYEYASGRAQLITPGTGVATGRRAAPGLVGVSADGTDVYFSTLDTLIPEDHNGTFLKFYDARTNGGFPLPPPAQPCAAAEECHGPGTEAPALPTQATAGALSGGNIEDRSAKPHRKKHHKQTKKKKRRHRGVLNRGGER